MGFGKADKVRWDTLRYGEVWLDMVRQLWIGVVRCDVFWSGPVCLGVL